MTKTDEMRREFLVNALSAGLYAVGLVGIAPSAWAMGKVPSRLRPGKSIYEISGDVRVNGVQANEDTFIGVNSTVTTGSNSYLVFVVGQDAFILRSNSHLKVEGNVILSQIKLISGKLLSVFGRRENNQKLQIKTTTASIGIRGTGMYLEVEPERTYVCTCYGTADLAASHDEKSHEQVVTEHHDAPRFILQGKKAGSNIEPAPVFNHTDDELALIEALVGRDVPFVTSGYGAPRKGNY